MEFSGVAHFCAFILFVLLSGFFSSSETAIMSVSRIRLRHLVETGQKGAVRLHNLLENPRRVLTCILIGNNIANVAASALATAFALEVLSYFGVTNRATSLLIITVIMTVIILIFGEITPKSMVVKAPEWWALRYARPIGWFFWLFYPVVVFFQWITVMVARLFGMSIDEAGKFLTEDDIKTVVTMGSEEGVLPVEKGSMIHGVLDFSETVVREIMTPRLDVVCMEVSCSVQDVVELIGQKGHSRIPVYEDKLDNLIGMIYAKDLLMIGHDNWDRDLRSYCREAVFIPESKPIQDLFKQMQTESFHIAIVMDEYGGFSGIVTMEDIIEEIIGDIEDEYDAVSIPDVQEIKPHCYRIHAGINIEDLSEAIGVAIPEHEDYDTFGGFVLSQFGKFPKQGESFVFERLTIIVKEIRKRRIIALEVVVTPLEDLDSESIG